jgi:alpha-N-arabinofuranosidase
MKFDNFTPWLLIPVLIGSLTVTAVARELNVSVTGSDAGEGFPQNPFRTISAAARVAQPGDVITVHQGVYRERINPPCGGTSDDRRIVYQAASGEKVVITGSEPMKNWKLVTNHVWRVTIPNSFFGSFNPYRDVIHGDWCSNPRGYHTGAVYLNGDWLTEAAKLGDVLKPEKDGALWFGQVDAIHTTIWAQFKGVNPNEQLVEINVRQTVFYPAMTGINYLTVRGFTLEDAATPWAPPTAEQIGLIGTHWSKGWIIETNVIRYSTCCGIALGKYGDQWDNRAESAVGYVGTIDRALTNGWNEATIGHHLVRDNDISHCEQTGIVGSLGAVFSTITGNTIHDIHVRRLFSGAEMAGIKLHGAIDVEISHNHIYHTCRGIWLDWMAQGTRVTRNLLNDNLSDDLFFEVDHGPVLVDNNMFLSPVSVHSRSQGIAYVHNLFAGAVEPNHYDGRQTPFLQPHSTTVAELHDNPCGDDRYYNNLFVGGANLSHYDNAQLPVWMNGNVFMDGAKPAKFEKDPLVEPAFNPDVKLTRTADGWQLEMKYDPAWNTVRQRPLVTTKLLGRAVIPDEAYEQPDGAPIRINTDYFGQPRSETHPAPGPFAHPDATSFPLKVW